MIKKPLTIIIVFITSVIVAQKNNSSPYSYFGIGDDEAPKTTEQSSMGGIGVAMKNLNYLNFVNPAAYADLRYATYGVGGKTTFLTLNDSKSTQSGNFTSLRYVALAFPIGKKAGFSAGLQPLSSVGYSLLNEKTENNEVLQVTKYTGKGGSNRLYASFGTYLFDGFSVGVEGAFIFGNIEKTILEQKKGIVLGTKYNDESNIRGGELKIGMQYKTNLSNKLQLHTGMAVRLSSDLTKRGTETLRTVAFNNSGVTISVDELYSKNLTSSINLPFKTIIGAGVGKENKWYFGINSEFKKSPTNQIQVSGYKYGNAFKSSFGGYYIPKINSISSYWDRVTYRAGIRYEDTGLQVNVSPKTNSNFTPVKDFGINVGVGLPLPRQLSSLNIGLEYGQKGTTNNNLIKENYYNIRLSLSLNSLNWFKKREID